MRPESILRQYGDNGFLPLSSVPAVPAYTPEQQSNALDPQGVDPSGAGVKPVQPSRNDAVLFMSWFSDSALVVCVGIKCSRAPSTLAPTSPSSLLSFLSMAGSFISLATLFLSSFHFVSAVQTAHARRSLGSGFSIQSHTVSGSLSAAQAGVGIGIGDSQDIEVRGVYSYTNPISHRILPSIWSTLL